MIQNGSDVGQSSHWGGVPERGNAEQLYGQCCWHQINDLSPLKLAPLAPAQEACGYQNFTVGDSCYAPAFSWSSRLTAIF